MIKKKTIKQLNNVAMWVLVVTGLAVLLSQIGLNVASYIPVGTFTTAVMWVIGVSGVVGLIGMLKKKK